MIKLEAKIQAKPEFSVEKNQGAVFGAKSLMQGEGQTENEVSAEPCRSDFSPKNEPSLVKKPTKRVKNHKQSLKFWQNA